MSRPWIWLSGMFFGFLLASTLTSQAGNFPGEQPVYSRDQGRQSLLFYVADGSDGAGKVEYICTADSGVATSTARWQVSRLSYDTSDRVSTIRWAGGTDNFTSVCDDRVSLSYS
jgi:YD repeat-containing protein